MDELIKKLLNVQKELKAPKDRNNSFGKYKYRSAEDILEAAKPLLFEQGLLLTLSDEIVMVGGRVYVKATARITDGQASHETTAYARESADKKGMDDSQMTGCASSYARKYALNGLFCIDDTKDADTDEFREQTKNAPQAPKKSIAQCRQELFAEAKKWGVSNADMKDMIAQTFGKQSSTALTVDEIDVLIRMLRGEP